MKAALSQIEEILRAKAPVTHKSLRPAARPEVFDALRSRVDIPADVAALWEWHDGTAAVGALEVVPQFVFLDVGSAIRYWNLWREAKVNFPHGPWRPDWIIIGVNGTGGVLVCDHDENVFLATPEAGEFVHHLATSFDEVVQRLLAALQDGALFDGFTAAYDDGELRWLLPHMGSAGAYDLRYCYSDHL
ncbi:hypothetical protein [Lentzea sp. NPDC003310]|uniref:hypothetical protein n=1 Tax=Lentzea sp. NPDC003310 TaxID=3154447 RepID=UPI0033A4ED84